MRRVLLGVGLLSLLNACELPSRHGGVEGKERMTFRLGSKSLTLRISTRAAFAYSDGTATCPAAEVHGARAERC